MIYGIGEASRHFAYRSTRNRGRLLSRCWSPGTSDDSSVTCEKWRRKIAQRRANFDLINRASNATLDRPLHGEPYFDTVNFPAHFKSDYDVFITPLDCNVSLSIFENVNEELILTIRASVIWLQNRTSNTNCYLTYS